MLGDECFVGEDAVARRGREGLPVQDGRGRAPSSTPRSCGRPGAPGSLFGRDGVAGLANVDITPELATRLAMAYGTTLKKGTTVVTSRDSSRSARMLKRAMMAGLNAAGVNVLDLEVASVPVTRFLIRSPGGRAAASRSAWSTATRSRSSSGSSTPTAPTSPRTRSARSSGCSAGGLPPGVRRPRSATSGSRPAPSSSTRPRSRPPSTSQAIRAARFKVVVDYAFGSTSFVMPNVLAKLGADVLAVNPYASTGRRHRLRPRRATRPSVVAASCGPRAPTSARCSTPTASASR